MGFVMLGLHCILFIYLFILIFSQYKENPEIYRRTAKHWAEVYAGGKNKIERV